MAEDGWRPTGPCSRPEQINAWRGDRHILRDVSFTRSPRRIPEDHRAQRRRQDDPVARDLRPAAAETGDMFWRGKRHPRRRDEFHIEHRLPRSPQLAEGRPDRPRESASSSPACASRSTAEDIDAALDRVGILSRGDLPARSLSAGQKRRLALARLLLADAALWILDEPVTNLDTAGIDAGRGTDRASTSPAAGSRIAAAHQRLLDDAPSCGAWSSSHDSARPSSPRRAWSSAATSRWPGAAGTRWRNR